MSGKRTFNEMEIQSINQKLPPNDYDKFGLNRLGLNRNCGYGLCQPEKDGYTCDLTKDFLRDLKFQQHGFHAYSLSRRHVIEGKFGLLESHNVIEGKFQSNDSHNYLPGAFSALRTIIANNVLPLITGGTSPSVEYPNYPNDLATLHLEILKRAYTQQTGTTPYYALNKGINLLTNTCIIEQTHIKQVYYSEQEHNWILQTDTSLIFKVAHDDDGLLIFGKGLTYITEARLAKRIPLITPIMLRDLIQNPTKLQNFITEFSDGFQLNKIQLEGPGSYIKLFESFANWNNQQHPDFSKFLALPLWEYIVMEQVNNDNSLVAYPIANLFLGFNAKHKTTDVKLSAARKSYNLLTQDKATIDFQPVEILALRESRLGQIAQDLSFLIGLKLPALYNALNFHLQNPLLPAT